ncbi:MAG: hypothetical protein OXU27_04335 [Candidatus Poribacteria bacterium]|nr:hypothetical protein [Candidatus Poribacteria bacterium]MDE0323575.1 hypothetical protein [Candidatus Poribacteria bacterium]
MTRKMVLLAIVLLGCICLFFIQTSLQTRLGKAGQMKNVLEPFVENGNTGALQHHSTIEINLSEPYSGPQTVEALLETFSLIAADSRVDEKYPQRDWLHMLLEKGIVIENYDDYSGYMAARRALVELENQPEMWTSDVFGLPPTTDWETFKGAFIERKIWEYEQFRAAIQANPRVDGGFFTGPEKRTFLPTIPGRVYVKRKSNGAVFLGESLDEAQQTALLYQGIHPKGYEIIYIDDDGEHLAEPPPPVTFENVFGTTTFPPQDEAAPTETWPLTTENTPQTEEKFSEVHLNKVHEPVPRASDDFHQFLESLSDEALIEFEKFLAEEFPAKFPRYTLSDPQTENTLDGRFSPERLQHATRTLNLGDFKDGLRRLSEEDQELLEFLKRHGYHDRISQKGEAK